jgi:hypothetical protein
VTNTRHGRRFWRISTSAWTDGGHVGQAFSIKHPVFKNRYPAEGIPGIGDSDCPQADLNKFNSHVVQLLVQLLHVPTETGSGSEWATTTSSHLRVGVLLTQVSRVM